jgi:hypothetical protein
LDISLVGNPVTVVCTVSYHPYDVFVKRYYGLTLPQGRTDLDVGKKITYKFASFHTEGDETVTGVPSAYCGGSVEQCTVKCGCTGTL